MKKYTLVVKAASVTRVFIDLSLAILSSTVCESGVLFENWDWEMRRVKSVKSRIVVEEKLLETGGVPNI